MKMKLEEIFADFCELFSHYVGNIEMKTTDSIYYPHEISITNNNRLIQKYTDGTVYKDRMVRCNITVEYDTEDNYGVMTDESTYEILGGSSCGHMTKGEALERTKRELDRYCFVRRGDEQLSLF